MTQTAMAQTGNWDAYQASGYDSGSGTQADPYIIRTAGQLAYFAERVKNNNDLTAYVKLADDIDLSEHWWRPIGPREGAKPSGFYGDFDGCGYTISGLRGNWGGEENHGFFSFINGGSVRNIIFEDAYLTNSTGNLAKSACRVGILAGGTNNSPVIENIIVRNSKIDFTKEYRQNNKWFLVGGLVGGSYIRPTYSNIYVDVDIDFTKVVYYDNNGQKQSWFGTFLGAADRNDNQTAQPTLENVYVAGSFKVSSALTNHSNIGTVIGHYDTNTDKTKALKGGIYYENVPNIDGTDMTDCNIDGTKVTAFTSSIKDLYNNYINDNSKSELLKWKIENGQPLFSNIKAKITEQYTNGEKQITYTLSGFDTSKANITWTLDGKTITPNEGTNNMQITVPLYNKKRIGLATIVIDAETVTVPFSIIPKYYSIDGLYAASYAGGKGTKADPYLIENDLQLARLAYEVNNATSANSKRVFSGLYFKLSKDIDLSAAIWMPIGNIAYTDNQRIFAGKFSGNGHTISNMRICWTDQAGVWCTWGLFAQLKGQSANETSFCSVTNLIIDSASVEKQENYTPVGNGANLGILVGEVNPFSEVSNIIVKNSIITDNEETYSRNMEFQIGGVAANFINGNSSNIFRIYNISSDTKINMLKNVNNGNKKVWIGEAFGGLAVLSNNQTYQIYPTNIYVHGNVIKTNTTNSNLIKGGIAAKVSPVPNSGQYSTWYYVNEETGTNVVNYGTKKTLADFATTFIQQNNTFIQENIPTDSCIWVYTAEKGFSFGNTVLTLDRGDADVITATTTGHDGTELYYWYISQDRKNWTQVTNTDGTPLLSHTLTLSYKEYNQYVYAVLEDQSSQSKYITIDKMTFNSIFGIDGDTYTVYVSNNIWDNNDRFTITYQWTKNDLPVGTNSPQYTPTVFSANDKIKCLVTVMDMKGDTIYSRLIYKATVVYLCPAGTIASNGTTYEIGQDNTTDADWGYSPDKPMLTWQGAYGKLEKDASWTENVIVLMGTSNRDVTDAPNNKGFYMGYWDAQKSNMYRRSATITGKWNNIDYNGKIEVYGDNKDLQLWGDTRFENITFNHVSGNYDILYCQYNKLEMGEGVQMTNYNTSVSTIGYGTIDGAYTTSFQIFGGYLNDNRFGKFDNANSIKKYEDAMPHGKEGFSITLKSGHFSTICVGGRQINNGGNQHGVMGTPNMPIKCTITMDIDRDFNDKHNINGVGQISDYDAGIILAGNHEGAMYADVDIIIKSGKVGRVVNGTLGSKTLFNYGGQLTPPYNSYMGRANILLDPASSEFAHKDDTREVTNGRVVVTELYGGSAGRGFRAGDIVENPFYGYSTVTINGGTFDILPAGNTEAEKIFSGIYGAGAGGMNGIGDDNHPTPDERIPYWNETKDVMYYGNYATAKNNLISYHCYNADTHTFTDVDPTNTSTKIIIKDGVFGSKAQPIYGIYGGGSGYMSKGLWTTKACIPNKNGGNLYGKAGKTVASITIDGGTFYCKDGIFAGGRGTDEYYSNNDVTGGVRSDYKELAKTYGNVELTIYGGTFHCPIYGGGYGVADAKEYGTSNVETLSNMARVYGKSTVNINGGLFYKNIYGGGDMAVIEYNGDGTATNVNISNDADIRGSVFGGGNGRPYRELNGTATNLKDGTSHPDSVGRVIGNTSVSFIGDSKVAPYIYGDIYGGGNLAQVQGNTYINLYAASFAGQIFGGGKGNLDASSKNTSADITGNTYVNLAQDQGGQEDGEDGKKIDNFSINVIWDKLWDAENNEFVVWSSDTERATTVDKTKFFANGKFLNPHNIYGGGNIACNVGTYNVDADGNVSDTANDGTGVTTVNVLKGMTPFSLLKTQEWKDAYSDNANPHFYVFGGGYGVNTKVDSTNVTVDVEGDYGIYNAEVDDDTEQLAKDHKTGLFKQQSTISVFDNSKGVPNFTVLGVMGGGFAGLVTGNTKVTVDGNTFIHRVYGGGFGDPNSTTNNTTGEVGGNTEVYVKGANIYGDVFGGGAGVAPKAVDDTPFTSVARVLGTTSVEISDDAKVFGRVYGGGDIANVGVYQETKPSNYYDQSALTSVSTIDQSLSADGTENAQSGSFIEYNAKGYKSFVNILGGDIYGSVFGGGKGLTKANATHYDMVGRINGNTLVHVANTETNTNIATQSSFDDFGMDSNGNTIPYIWNRIYGGCAYGTVDGNTLVHIEGGMLGINVFGGGYGNVPIVGDLTDESSGESTDLSTLTQVLGKKDTNNKGTYANILGNTKVQIDGGSWIWNRVADNNGNITTWTATDDGNNKICENLDEFKQIVNSINNAKLLNDISDAKAKAAISKIMNDKNNQKFFDITNCMFNKNYNIFGGGNRACNVGTYNSDGSVKSGTGCAVVEINHSPLGEIEDTKGKTIDMLDFTTIQGLCYYLNSRSVEHPQFSIFGAGYGANTKVANTKVFVRPGAYMKDNGDHLEVAGQIFRYRSQVSDMAKYMEHEQGVYADFLKVSKDDKRRYYGSSDGGNADGTDNDLDTYVRYRASRMAWMLGTPNFTFCDIHGGGFSGYVTGDTYVETDNHLDCRNIYGAGLGAKPYGEYDSSAKYDFGSIGGSSKVFMKSGNVSTNVYGGGAGIESQRINGKDFTDFSAKAGEAFDFPDMARVNGRAEVHIYGRPIITPYFKFDRTLIFGNVYGGGDVANVGNDKAEGKKFAGDHYLNNSNDFTTLVNIRGAKLFAQVFAGGNGREASACADYTKLGGVYGNACVVLDRPVISYPYMDTTTGESYDPANKKYMVHPNDDINPGIMPVVSNRIYGGCENGTIYGNTLVAIHGGQFGSNIFGGGWGNIDTLTVNNDEVISVTSANITGNTNMYITGGEMELTSYWLKDERSWEPADIIDGKTYSPQYNHKALKFKINHNFYGGGNTACIIGEKDSSDNLVNNTGNTYITMTKGLLFNTTKVISGQSSDLNFFESNEWREVYNKVGSPHFAIFGGGYGENTNILGDTYLDVAMTGRGSIHNHAIDLKVGEEYKHFISGYSVMDIVGGGYSGKVEGETHIVGDGGVFCRRVFGGGFYNTVKATNVNIKAIDCQDIFGGGLMGDVLQNTNVNIGTQATSSDATFTNTDIYIHNNVFGGNDVSGYVNVSLDKNGYFEDNGGTGTHINIYGGNIYGNVYGAGNGDYLYALDKKGNTKVTVNEHYPLNPNDPNSEKEPLVYTVPMRENMPSYKAASDAAKIVNINSWRPMTNKVNINIKGEANEDGKRVIIKGDVYGGGNSATVQKVQMQSVRSNNAVGYINLNIGSHVQIGRVFMGCNGDELFTASEDNDFMNKFQKLNGDIDDYTKELNLADSIDWMNDPSNKGISTLWLSTKNEERYLVYPHLLDLYFQPVETDIQGSLTWNDTITGEGLTDCTIGTFCCGGNRGNMNVYPKTADDYDSSTAENAKKIGNVLEYYFPEGLTITDKIVGGCNNANYDYKGKVSHEGGYLLGKIHTSYPFIKLNIRNKFQPTEQEGAYVGGNVYGGCFKTGTIRGDVSVVLESDMLEGKSKEKLEKSNELLATNAEYSALNVYGAGYGMESYVYGNTYVKMGKGIICSKPSMTTTTTQTEDGYTSSTTENIFNSSGSSANFIYGGGQQGNVIGKTDVKILNGHVFKSVTGGSYSGYVWGSTQIRIGYPKYYVVNPGYGGIFRLNRTDQNNKDIDEGKKVASETIKQTIHLISDDIITQAVYDAITARYDFQTKTYNDITSEQKTTFFKEEQTTKPSIGWDNVNIVIGEAVYGGGYSLAQSSTVLANNTTVLKYTPNYNLDSGFTSEEEQKIIQTNLGGTTVGFAGNTTVLIGDRTTTSSSSDGGSTTVTQTDRDHITISRQDMKVANVANGQDLLGYYYKDKDGKYHYIYQAGTYYKGGSTLPSDMEGTYVYQYDNEGGIFGDGHLSYAEGFRSADLTGYGFASTTIQSPKILNTFQRMDILRLTDNCFTLLGARDYATNAMDKTPYSISRLGEIQMIANNIVTKGDSLASHTTPRARNYMGFANNVHYLGALTSNVAFSDQWYDGNGKSGSYEGASTYQAIKQKYIDDFYNGEEGIRDNTHIFEKRNDGTAQNMIGIASGYALKLLNAQELISENGATEEKLYYGPIYGIIEMNLIDVREDEGGGYVYADNVHKRTAAEGETAHDVDFLETTGNFVFPYSPIQGRYIVDDCFPISYASLNNGENPDEKIDAHYWYVTGFNYHYTAHITGFTFDSSEANPLYFSSNNTDGIVALSGLKKGQEVSIVNWRTYSAHNNSYECDLEKRNYQVGEAKDKYILNVGAANSTTYIRPLSEGEDTPTDPAKLPGFAAKLSMEEGKNSDNYEILQSKLPTVFTGGDARIVFQLTDKINNTTTEYYNAHLAEPCKGTLVLSAPAFDTNGDTITGNIAITRLYTRTGDGKTEPFVYTEVNNGQLSNDIEYFYKNGETSIYQSTNNREFFVMDQTTGKYTHVDKDEVSLGSSTIFYCNLKRYYTYTIDLTIEYVQGPDIEGHITIENCVLPGERIRVKKDKVVINADQAFSVNGYYWRIGKRHEENGEWTFDDNTPWSKYTTADGYDTYNQSDKEGSGLFAGCYYDKTEDYLDIPAYYYMNGYGIQLGVTMNVPGLNDILPVKMIEADKLTIHNYQRMNPHRSGIDLHIAEAIIRAKEDTGFPTPRIYITDQSDLTTFVNFIDTIGTTSDAPRYGAYAQFVIQNDLTMPTSGITIPANFAGTVHGNGHIINGIDKGSYLFKTVSGNIYNLGLSSGKISNKEASNGKVTNYHCCYEYAPTTGKSSPVVYHMDGTLDNHYTVNDFKYGRVAYDLNEYYLRARYNNDTAEDTLALKYVYDYVANGDYQYAYRQDAITGKNTGVVYLRTGKDSDLPNYEQSETRHDKTHAIDKARAQNYVAATADTPESREGNYLPLFNSAGYGTETMNDFIFWGQSLQSTPADYPTTISSQQLNNMTNRVYRTAGYYGDTKLDVFHYNAFSRNNSNMTTYIHDIRTTAIDFTCHNDLVKAEGMTTDGIYYPPVQDNATVFHDLNIKDGVTKNLLVYTAANDEDEQLSTEAYDIAHHTLNYGETTKETLIKGHHIVANDDVFETSLFHLVERTPEGLNSEGEDCDNNDFCAPIAFTVTNHAWYTRKPMYYASENSGAWEGICLPFNAYKVEASLNGEISHFYGTPTNEELSNPTQNIHSLHHEYWLRGLMSIDTNGGNTSAIFQRPGELGSKLFAPTDTEGNAICKGIYYNYENPFFVDTYENRLYNKDDNPYYASNHIYRDYLPLTSNVPYIVRFPGERYYEFDLSSNFYNDIFGRNTEQQTITFNAYGVDNTEQMTYTNVIIPVTTTMMTTVNDSYVHQGTFAATNVEEGSVYGMNDKGTAFDDASTLSTVMPFRTYITIKAKARQANKSVIFINESTGIDKMEPRLSPNDDADDTNNDYLTVHPIGEHRVRIESSCDRTINVYTLSGQLYRILDIQQGSAIYSGFTSRLYLFENIKVIVR